jgi:major type 1 subunit fimbrin (pilin)
MKHTLLAIAIASLGLASFGAHAEDGTITINGTITDQTCTVSGTGKTSGNDFIVQLPPIGSSAFSAANMTAGKTPFSISLEGCSGSIGSAHVYFEHGPLSDDNTGNLISNGVATNVQVQLLNGDSTVINAAAADGLQNSKVTSIAGGSATLNYWAQYFSTAPNVTEGSVSTSVKYTVVYP